MELYHLEKTEKERLKWSLKQFKQATALSSLLKALDELGEIEDDILSGKKNAEEYADFIMAFLDSAARDGISFRIILLSYYFDLSRVKFERGFQSIYLQPLPVIISKLKSVLREVKLNINTGISSPITYALGLHLIFIMGRTQGIDFDMIFKAYVKKIKKNKRRKWKMNPDFTYSHI